MKFFQEKVDMRSREAMVSFLSGHRRYDTMSSVNRSTSYAHCIKLHRLGLSREQIDAAWPMLEVNFWSRIDGPMEDFADRYNGRYVIGSNGRSGGYLVLYEGSREPSEHKSFCPCCGQRNFKKVPPALDPTSSEGVIAGELLRSGLTWRDDVYLGQSAIQSIGLSDEEKLNIIRKLKFELKDCSATAKCGVCSGERVNYARLPMKQNVYPGRSIDQGEDFSDWSMEALRDRVRLVQDFDKACDEVRAAFIELLDTCEVAEEEVMVPKVIKRLTCKAA
jgi:hypothetical protein